VSRVTPPAGFEWIRADRLHLLVRTDVQSWLAPLLRAAPHALAGYTTRPLAGGRGGACIVPAHQVVVRPYRRGGLPARLLRDTYFGCNPRPFRELCVTATLQQRGAPVVEVYGAAVVWRIPACYRGWLATRYVDGARTFWEWLSAAPSATASRQIFGEIGRAVRRLHDCGARHPDLNANNILVSPAAGVLFIDFDRARLAAGNGDAPARDLDRLWRSLRKLDREGRHVTPADFELLRAAYRDGSTCE
jgi:tRNA A-37 threonylcarbamoyl transferase component Bud32